MRQGVLMGLMTALALVLSACSVDSEGGGAPAGGENNTHTITTQAATGGTISPATAQVNHGATTSFDIQPQEGYSIASVSGCGGSLSGNTYTTAQVTGPCTLTAEFSLVPVTLYTLEVGVQAGGGTVEGGGTYAEGTTVQVGAQALAGYTFIRWIENNQELSVNSQLSINVTQDRTIVAVFTLNNYTLTTQSATGGTISPATAQVNHGATTSFDIQPQEGYSIASVSGCGGSLSGNTYTTAQVTGPCTLTAEFTLNNYTLTAQAQQGGTVTEGGTYSFGTTVSLKATPETGYAFTRWVENNQELSSESQLDVNITQNRTVTAEFSPLDYTIGGNVSGLLEGGKAVLSLNDTEELTITQNGDFVFSGSLTHGSAYSVSVVQVDLTSDKPAIQRCVVEQGNGGINGEHVTNIAVNCSHELFFAADNGIDGIELWKTNGAGEPVMVKEINPSGNGIASNNRPDLTMATLRNTVYFAANDGENGAELWKSDGTEEGTQMVSDIHTTDGSLPLDLTVVGESLYFIAFDGSQRNLYRLTHGGMPEVVTSVPGGPSERVVIGQTLYLAIGYEYLVKVSGTEATPIWDTTGISGMTALSALNDTLYFVECADGAGCELKKVNADNTVLSVEAIDLPSEPYLSAVAGGALYLVDPAGKVFSSDGTSEGTGLLGEGLGYIYEIAAAGDAVYLSSDDTGELLRADAQGVSAVSAPDTWPWAMAAVDDTLYFAAWNDDLNVDELLVYNPETNSTESVPEVTNPEHLFAVGDTLYFQGRSSAHGKELYVLNSAVEGARLVLDINQKSYGSYPASFAQVGDSFYFTANDGLHDKELWVSDGTEAGTRMLQDIRIGYDSNPKDLMAAGGKLFFTATNDNLNLSLWSGDAQGVEQIYEFGSIWSYSVGSYAAVGDKVYLTTSNAGDLWVSDGTSEPTKILNWAPRNNLTAMGDKCSLPHPPNHS